MVMPFVGKVSQLREWLDSLAAEEMEPLDRSALEELNHRDRTVVVEIERTDELEGLPTRHAERVHDHMEEELGYLTVVQLEQLAPSSAENAENTIELEGSHGRHAGPVSETEGKGVDARRSIRNPALLADGVP